MFASFCLQTFFQKWKTRGNMKDRTLILHHQKIWTTAAPKTSLNSLQQTWRTWRSITTLERIQAATRHLERWWTRGQFFFYEPDGIMSWRNRRRGFHFSYGLLPGRAITVGLWREARKEMHFTGDIPALTLTSHTETVDTDLELLFFGGDCCTRRLKPVWCMY